MVCRSPAWSVPSNRPAVDAWPSWAHCSSALPLTSSRSRGVLMAFLMPPTAGGRTMSQRRKWLLGIVLGTSLSLGSMVAEAETWATQTECESVDLAGQARTLVKFAVRAPSDMGICLFAVEGVGPELPPDSCRALAAQAPSGWTFQIRPEDGGVIWMGEEDCVLPGEAQSGFGIALNGFGCCYRVLYYDVTFAVINQEIICFDCSPALPARKQSWGSIKVQYR